MLRKQYPDYNQITKAWNEAEETQNLAKQLKDFAEKDKPGMWILQ